MDDRLLAGTLYTVYCDSVGWKNFSGGECPPWTKLPVKIQDAWIAVARKARAALR